MHSKNIIKSITFLSVLLIILYVISYLMVPSNSSEGGLYKKLTGYYSAPDNTFDYVIIGDSESSTSISPMEIWRNHGYAGYNCGVPGQKLQDTYYMLDKLLQKQSPKIVILEANALYRNFKYTNAFQDVVDEAAKKAFPIYKYHNSWKYINLGMLKDIGHKPKGSAKVYKGFYYNVAVKPYTNGPYVNETTASEKIDDLPLLFLNKIVDLCKSKDIQLILYSTPSPLCWTYEKHNSITAIAKKNHLLYIDLNLKNDILGIDWYKDTRDGGNHLNFYGAKKVSDYMGTYLSEHMNLSDHSKDKLYKSWNQELKRYLRLTKQI